MKNTFLFIFFCCSVHLTLFANEILQKREIQLKEYLQKLRTAQNDAAKKEANLVFKNYLLETIKLEGAFNYPFAELRSVGTIKSPDNAFRFFNWNIENDDFTNSYNCFILRFDDKKREYRVSELIDNSFAMSAEPDDYLDENNWYGALYYKIIPVTKSGKTIYTLLGYDAGNQLSHTKIIDAITFSGSRAKLGSPIFKVKSDVFKRMFYEHSKKSVMSLNYDESRKKIVLDHLMPESPTMEGFKEFYVPDMSYDSYKYDGSRWIHEEDIIAINAANANKGTVKSYDMNDKGEIVEKESKAKWMDPSNENAPGGSNIHRAVVPEEITVDKKDTKTKSKPATAQKSKKNSVANSAIITPQQYKKKKKK